MVKWTLNMADDELLFKGTCEVFELKRCNDVEVLGTQFIDPCSCRSYYQCSNYQMLHQTCAEGTAWDYETKGCKHYQDVLFQQNCTEDNVWTRCNVTESRLAELKLFCTNETSTVPTTRPTTASAAPTSSNINPGVIVGSIIGGAVIAVIVLIVAFCLYRRNKRDRINKKRSGTIAHNPEYFEGGQPDDPYAVIDDHVIRDVGMNDPTYNGSTLGGTMSQQNGTFTNSGFDDTGEDAVYDNSGALIVGPGYTSTIRRSVREYETPTGAHSSRENLQSSGTGSHLAAAGQSDGQRGGNLYVDLNGNNNKSSENSEHVGNEIPSSVLESGSEYAKGHNDENSPDYFVLEKSEDHL
ncbi:uncharacterized protein LOC123528571 [Mercenaria mercenaria]|uniref:uncharacterized protein LOC123528571 n=1 Tax=Mercenaria mercenaria TaxID=6596 RepID=UPI00234F7D95|nr:uncharacterized protein LOC123528571 [Mercenaria mercenaria]XP_053378421.1 uncharacterized protein LOC123528571 [Mercenaria mercenaria]XP_053378422.1 uncharacterized protein LOC123528571 [Mercenaria mercenaria]